MRKKPHPADEADLAKIARAISFNVHLRLGPSEKTNRRAKTLAAAVKIADKLGTTASGRRPMIYAITPEKMTVHVPAHLVAQARQEAATAPRVAAGANSAPRRPQRRTQAAEDAARGVLPQAPDFSAETHKRYRPKLAQVVTLVEAGDVASLRAFAINPVSTSPKAIARYRDLAILALESAGGTAGDHNRATDQTSA